MGDIMTSMETLKDGSRSSALELDQLWVRIAEKDVVKGISLTIRPGEVHAIMGPNGSGKTTLASTIMGKAGYEVTKGSIKLGGKDITLSPTYERARAGLFMISQYPAELVGISFFDIAREVSKVGTMGVDITNSSLEVQADSIGLSRELLGRSVNVGFSGGEKKRAETLQLMAFGARIAILDEIDSGLDIDALRDVSRGIARLVAETGVGVLVITHYSRLLKELNPDYVHVFANGVIQRTGDKDLAFELERTGYVDVV